jgi:sn-glycerol 3-phosphate transport system ATP-binding protein
VVRVAGLSVRDLCLHLGSFRLTDICLDVRAGSCCVLLGPTGSGKSLLVESICGLRRPSSGSVQIAGREVTRLDPSKRNIGYLPQDYALLPFQTVRENLAFGLLARRVPADQRRQRVARMLELLRMEHLLERKPAQLSGGERQRLALGRAMIGRPDLLLLDEPLSALDETTAEELMGEMLRLRRQFGITALHICHSLEEALRMGDRLALIQNGRLVQCGTPQELYARPRNLFTARLLRLPAVVAGDVRQSGPRRRFCISGQELVDTDLPAGPAYGVLPLEAISISSQPPTTGDRLATFKAVVLHNPLSPLRPELRLGGQLTLTVPGLSAGRWTPGSEVFVSFPRREVHVMLDETN